MFGRSKNKASVKTRKKGTGTVLAVEEFDFEGFRVVLSKKRVKNMNLRVKPPDGRVEVSMPSWMDRSQAKAFVLAKKDWIIRRQKEVQDSPRLTMSAEEKAASKEKMEPFARAYIAKWEPIMGVQSKSLALRDMSSRWGSCNPSTGRICLNVQLLNYPEECLEYVVVHELCHLLERGHGEKFKALMDTFLPDWRERRALLRK